MAGFLEQTRLILGSPWDLTVRVVRLNRSQVTVVYLKGLVKEDFLSAQLLKPLTQINRLSALFSPAHLGEILPTAAEVKTLSSPVEAAEAVLAGWSILHLTESAQVCAIYLPGWIRRLPQEPADEKTITGPKEGFTEDLLDNLTFIRRWIKDPALQVEEVKIGTRTKTPVLIVYLKDLAHPRIVHEVKKRLSAIEIDAIINSGYLKELITDERLTIFPLIQSTGRSDKVTAGLLEGRVAILVDKSPSALLVPVTINELYQAPDDYFLSYWLGSALRLLRLVGNNLAVVFPGLYLALVTINTELLPFKLVFSIAGLRNKVPFPIVMELVLTSLIIELFYESAIRLHTSVASVGGVVTGIVLSFASVQSGLISSPTLVVAVISTISLFSGPSYETGTAWRILKYFLILGGAIFGLLGLAICGVLILGHLATLQSFGVSYLAPWAPLQPDALTDGLLRKPLWLKKKRFSTYHPRDRYRQDNTRKEKSEDE